MEASVGLHAKDGMGEEAAGVGAADRGLVAEWHLDRGAISVAL